MSRTNDTIVAVSSPPGRSPRGLIRLTGPNAAGILRQLTDGDAPVALVPRQLTCTHLFGKSASPLPVLAALFPSPHSYTGQDLVEIQCPGNPALLERLLHEITARDTRLADPGEFTFRAFLAGKFDLTQAEGIAATIAAASDSQLQAAALLRQGALGRFATRLVDALAQQLALVEAGIDFVDQDDIVPIPPPTLAANLERIAGELDDLLAHSRAWGTLEALPRVVLVGPPNSGKSTLFNALLGRTRAVTSPVPGSTRDILTEPLTLTGPANRPIEVLLIDIAGLDTPAAALDHAIQAAAQTAIAQADLLLFIEDGRPVRFSLPQLPNVPGLYIRTKTDLLPTIPLPTGYISVSAPTGAGLAQLRHAIAQQLGQHGVSLAADLLALQPRHQDALQGARTQLAECQRLLAPQRVAPALQNSELIAGSLRLVLDALATLGGQMTPDDVIGRIFATFCVGK